MARSALAPMGVIVAGEIAGAWDKFGGFGAKLSNLAQVVEVAMKQLVGGQNLEWQRLAALRRRDTAESGECIPSDPRPTEGVRESH